MSRLVPWCVLAVVAGGPAAAAPLDLIPRPANLVVVVDSPRKLAGAARNLPAVDAAVAAIPAFREFLDSTPVRRLDRLVKYYEAELGHPWPVLLDKVAGGGVAVGALLGPDPAPSVLAVRGTDEAVVAKAFALVLAVTADEAGRRGGPSTEMRKAASHGVDTYHLGPDFHAARVGPNVLFANRQAALNLAVGLAAGAGTLGSVADRPGPATARRLVGGDPLAWLWFDLARAKQTPAGRDFFATGKKDFLGALVLGASVDAADRSDLVAAGLHGTDRGLSLAVRLPAGRAGVRPELAVHVPPAGRPASLPLLEPPGVVYSQSFHLDLAAFWRDRAVLLNAKQAEEFETGVRTAGKFLPNTTAARLLEQWGPHHRLVVAAPPPGSAPRPNTPPAAFVTTMRDPAFGKTAAAALRAGAALAGFQYALRMSEETVDGVEVVTYRRPPDDDREKGLPPDLSPTFAAVGDSFLVATDDWLAKALIPRLRTPPAAADGSPLLWRGRFYAAGGAALLAADPDPLAAAAVLNESVGLDRARSQLDAFLGWARTLGGVELTFDHQPEAYQIKLEWAR